jgi:HlyD family secretion protein
VDGGRARLQPVAIGQEAGLVTEVAGGLDEGDVVIVHPGNEVEDGTRVRGENRPVLRM